MSFGYRTPESLLARSDSKNPSTTCRGLTSAGRPCRRALAPAATMSSTDPLDINRNGVVTGSDAGPVATFLCWQHQDQANTPEQDKGKKSRVFSLKQRSSIDTLIEKFGVIGIGNEKDHLSEDMNAHAKPLLRHEKHLSNTDGLRKRNSQLLDGYKARIPLTTVPEDKAEARGHRRPQHTSQPRHSHLPARRDKPQAKSLWLCCAMSDTDDLPPPRRSDNRAESRHAPVRRKSRPRPLSDQITLLPSQEHYIRPASPPVRRMSTGSPPVQQMSAATVVYPQIAPLVPEAMVPMTPTRSVSQQQSSYSPPNLQTTKILSLIPPHLSPSTTSALLAELSKQISAADESGYIYIFWLTPEADESKPDDETASSLLDPDEIIQVSHSARHLSTSSDRSPQRSHRQHKSDRQTQRNALTAQALQRFASVKDTSTTAEPPEPKKILLKIGRASNVHRRLSQWSKQCGQNITLIRYYPYQPQTRQCSSKHQHQQQQQQQRMSRTQSMVPHVHRVERLIHLELADQRVVEKGTCEQCGRKHKEWFEVEATRDGVKAVDEVVRRWVGWAQQMEAYGWREDWSSLMC